MVRLVDSIQNIHQGTFTCTIFPEECMNLPGYSVRSTSLLAVTLPNFFVIPRISRIGSFICSFSNAYASTGINECRYIK